MVLFIFMAGSVKSLDFKNNLLVKTKYDSIFYQLQLSNMYQISTKKSFYWYQKKALEGDCYAQLRVAYMYLKGLEVEQDDFKSYIWFWISNTFNYNPKVSIILESLEKSLGVSESYNAQIKADLIIEKIRNQDF